MISVDPKLFLNIFCVVSGDFNFIFSNQFNDIKTRGMNIYCIKFPPEKNNVRIIQKGLQRLGTEIYKSTEFTKTVINSTEFNDLDVFV